MLRTLVYCETDMLVAALNEIIADVAAGNSQLKIPLKMYIRKLNIC
jgi:hypothetical protein